MNKKGSEEIMKISTKFHGDIEIHEKEILAFESGIPGFLDEKQFTLLALEETPFIVLQSIATKEVAFVMANPFDFFQTYEFELSDELLNELHIQSEQDVVVFVILTVREPFEDTTANLQAPVIINVHNKLGKQYITNKDTYKTRHLLIQPPVSEKLEAK